jgi:hypothetical protein
MTLFKYYPGIYLEGLRKIMKPQVMIDALAEIQTVCPEYKWEALQLEPTYWFCENNGSNIIQETDIHDFTCLIAPHRLRSSGQSFWLRIQRYWVRFPALPDFLRSSESGMGPLSLMRTTEELLERKSSGSGLENRD